MSQTLEKLIALAVEKSGRKVLTELADELRRDFDPIDPDKLYSYAEAAEYMGVSEACVRERVRSGDLEAIPVGKYRKIPHSSISAFVRREQDKLRFQRDQEGSVLTADVDDPLVLELLGSKPPRRRQGKRK